MRRTKSEKLIYEFYSILEKCEKILLDFISECGVNEITFDEDDIGNEGCIGDIKGMIMPVKSIYSVDTFDFLDKPTKMIEIYYENENDNAYETVLSLDDTHSLINLCRWILDNKKNLIKKYGK